MYAILKYLVDVTGLTEFCISHYELTHLLIGKFNSRRTPDYIKSGLDELIKENIIVKTDEFQKHYIIDCSNLCFNTKEEHFVIITFQELRSILQMPSANNFSLLKYFVCLIGTLSNKIDVLLPSGESKNRVVGTLTIESLSEQVGVSVRSIIEYNKILEDAHLIYIYRQNDFVIDKNNNIKSLPNVYGRYCDKEYIDTFAGSQQKYEQSFRYVEKNVSKVNSNRRLAQIYQQLLKGNSAKYTHIDILAVYDYVLLENKKYEELYNKTQYDGYLDKIRDVEIFKEFDFIDRKED